MKLEPIMNRKEALEAGLQFYEGKPCKNCGGTQRNVSDWNCTECGRARARVASEKAKHDGRRKINRQKYESGEAGKANRKRWYEGGGRTANRKAMLKSKFGITLEDYDRMLLEQQGCCKVCGIHVDDYYRHLAVDHDHTTGKVRALLCDPCNVALGMLKEDTDIMKKLIKYVEGHSQ